MNVGRIVNSIWLSAAALALCGPTTGLAQDMPKAFDFNVTFTFATTSSGKIGLGEKSSGTSWSGMLVATNDAGGVFMNNMVATCASFTLQVGDKRENVGACAYEDKEGDQLHETYRSTVPGKGSITFIGGTGKFAGIKCDGEFKIVGFARQGAGGVGKKNGSCSAM